MKSGKKIKAANHFTYHLFQYVIIVSTESIYSLLQYRYKCKAVLQLMSQLPDVSIVLPFYTVTKLLVSNAKLPKHWFIHFMICWMQVLFSNLCLPITIPKKIIRFSRHSMLWCYVSSKRFLEYAIFKIMHRPNDCDDSRTNTWLIRIILFIWITQRCLRSENIPFKFLCSFQLSLRIEQDHSCGHLTESYNCKMNQSM